MGYEGWPLELMRDPQNAPQALQARLALSDPDQRRTAVEMLGFLGGRPAVDALCVALRDPEPRVRVEAARALGVLDDPAAMPALARAVARPDAEPEVDLAVRHALALLSRHAYASACRNAQSSAERQPFGAAGRSVDRGTFCCYATCRCWSEETTVLPSTPFHPRDEAFRRQAGDGVGLGGRTIGRLA
jgi:hypothetical protein